MKLAEILINCGGGLNGVHTLVAAFDTTEVAYAEFDRLKDILKRRSERANDLEKVVEIKAITQVACPITEIVSIALCDFARSNEHEAGVRDAFPNLFKR